MTIAERLIKARGDKTREEVAAAIGVSLSAIAMYENGDRVPREMKRKSSWRTTITKQYRSSFFNTLSHET